MCDPVSIAVVTAAASIASTGASFYAQSQQADAEAAFQQQQFELTSEASRRNFYNQAVQSNLRISQEEEAGAQERQGREAERARARATAEVAAGAAGVSGLSVDALLADYDRSALMRDQTTRRNLALFRQQTGQELRGLRAQAVNRATQALPSPVQRPSALAAGLQITGQGLSGYTSARGIQAERRERNRPGRR